jgi:hypothetical protein
MPMWTEPEVGGEWYIPLRLKPETRTKIDDETTAYYGLDDEYHEAVMTGFSHPATATDVETGEIVRLVYYCGEWSQVKS